jgi:UDP-galactopyranose mutase
LRFTYDNNYFSDRYQGIPIGGYTALFEAMLEGIEVRLNVDYFAHRTQLGRLAQKVVYTGCIDQYFNYALGRLEYRSLEFDNAVVETDNFQGNAVINYCDTSEPFTRIIEHKHFEGSSSSVSVITREYPRPCSGDAIPYYPVNDAHNQGLYRRYQELSQGTENVIFGGRLSEYKYMDMHVVIESAMNRFRSESRQASA